MDNDRPICELKASSVIHLGDVWTRKPYKPERLEEPGLRHIQGNGSCQFLFSCHIEEPLDNTRDVVIGEHLRLFKQMVPEHPQGRLLLPVEGIVS
jgi:hypothetical protein